jgi:hypothetical protein
MQAKYFYREKHLIIRPLKGLKQSFARMQLHVIHEVQNPFIRWAFPAKNAWKWPSNKDFRALAVSWNLQTQAAYRR